MLSEISYTSAFYAYFDVFPEPLWPRTYNKGCTLERLENDYHMEGYQAVRQSSRR